MLLRAFVRRRSSAFFKDLPKVFKNKIHVVLYPTNNVRRWFFLLSDGSEGLNVYVSTKWTQHEIEAAEKQRLDDIESTLSMRLGSTFSHSTRTRPGVNDQNRIVHAM